MTEKILIGIIKCPYCGVETPLRESKKGKAYFNCPDGCGQFFARNARADKLLRDSTLGAKLNAALNVQIKEEEKIDNGKRLADRGSKEKKTEWGTIIK